MKEQHTSDIGAPVDPEVCACVALHTWGGEEGPGEPLVSGNVSDLCGDVDESTDHRGDSVKAQHSVTLKGKYYMLA